LYKERARKGKEDDEPVSVYSLTGKEQVLKDFMSYQGSARGLKERDISRRSHRQLNLLSTSLLRN